MVKKYAAWIACGTVFLAGILWVGFGDDDAGQGNRFVPEEKNSGPLSGKSRASGGVGHRGGRVSRSTSRVVRAEPITEAERLVREGEASPAKVAAIAEAAALVPQFQKILQLPAEEAAYRTASLMDEVGDLLLLSDPLVSAIHDVLLTASPKTVLDYATTNLERQNTPQSACLLADLLHHPNEEIRDSALKALKSMAGDKLNTPEEAENWARNWRLTPQEQAEQLDELVSWGEKPAPPALSMPLPPPVEPDEEDP